MREFLAECLATFILISIGCGANAQSRFGRLSVGAAALSSNLAWGWAVAMAIWVSGGVSGGHLNPAITLAMTVLGRRNLKQMFAYWTAQYLGSFVGSVGVYFIYYDALNNFDGGQRSVVGEKGTGGIWATYPQPYLSLMGGVIDQIFGTMVLTINAMALSDKFNAQPGSGMFPLCIGGLVTVLSSTYTLNCGGAINPSRDFSPRLFTAIAGWGTKVFTVYNYWFWIPLFMPHVGAICGALLYQTFVGIHAEPREEINALIVDVQKENFRNRDNDVAQPLMEKLNPQLHDELERLTSTDV